MESNISDHLSESFELQRIIDWIETNDCQRIALQFPSDQLRAAPDIILELERRLGNKRQFFILADTSYRSCCLDEIAAEHANCDSLVHFGDACFTKATGAIPSLYIFGKQQIDFDGFRRQINAHIPQDIGLLVVLCDSIYTQFEDEIESVIKTIVYPSIGVHLCKLTEQQHHSTMRLIHGRAFPNDFQASDKNLLIFIGERESPLLALFRMTIPHLKRVLHYVPNEDCVLYNELDSAGKALMKRLYLVEKVRDSRTIGLVVGATALEGCKEAIGRIRKLCRLANKKLYVFHIGKLNEAKLTNFGTEVDVFILLSCPYGILLDGTKFYKPIVSMVEAEMALNQNDCYTDLRWTGEFQNLFKDEIRPLNEEMADLSLTSGAIRSYSNGNNDGKDKQLVEYSAGDYFVQRSWTGLEDGHIEDQGTDIKQGRSGIASRYEEEPSS